jgi:hypothetical protein
LTFKKKKSKTMMSTSGTRSRSTKMTQRTKLNTVHLNQMCLVAKTRSHGSIMPWAQ